MTHHIFLDQKNNCCKHTCIKQRILKQPCNSTVTQCCNTFQCQWCCHNIYVYACWHAHIILYSKYHQNNYWQADMQTYFVLSMFALWMFPCLDSFSVSVIVLKEGMQIYHTDIFCLEYVCFVNVPLFGQYFCVSDSTKRGHADISHRHILSWVCLLCECSHVWTVFLCQW